MKTSLILSITILFTIASTYSQVTEQNYTLGTDIYIESEALSEQRQIQIYLPPNYTETLVNYPVLYILDGQFFFNYAISLSNKFRQSKLTPEFIIVGINSSYPERFSDYSRDQDNFLEFLSTEVVGYVEKNYRTSQEKLFFGWEYAGSLGFHNLLKGKIDFNGYMLASPFPIWNPIDALDSITECNSMLYFSSIGPDEYSVYHGTHKLDSVLTNNTIKGLEWKNVEFNNDEHHSTGYPTLYHGLRSYFKYYPEFQIDAFDKFIELGGLPYAYDYVKIRAQLFGFTSELSFWSKFTIIRSAYRAENFEYFDKYVKEFVNDELIKNIKYRALDIASFYEKNGQFLEAIKIYKSLQKVIPDSNLVLRKIGEAYSALGNSRESKKYLKEADKIAASKK